MQSWRLIGSSFLQCSFRRGRIRSRRIYPITQQPEVSRQATSSLGPGYQAAAGACLKNDSWTVCASRAIREHLARAHFNKMCCLVVGERLVGCCTRTQYKSRHGQPYVSVHVQIRNRRSLFHSNMPDLSGNTSNSCVVRCGLLRPALNSMISLWVRRHCSNSEGRGLSQTLFCR